MKKWNLFALKVVKKWNLSALEQRNEAENLLIITKKRYLCTQNNK